jgi:hypothetical protein
MKSICSVSAGGLFLDELDSFGTVVKGDEVSTSNVEAVEVFNCVFSIINIFVNDEGRSFFISLAAFTDLPDWAESSENLVKLLVSNLVWQVPHEYYLVDLWCQFNYSLLLVR